MSIVIKHGSKKALPQIKELWSKTFGDDQAFIDMFLSTFYRPGKTLLAYDGKKLVSMLFYMDVSAKYFKKKKKCAYLYGVATELSERRQGYFTRLHEAYISQLRTRGYDLSLVIPENDSLFSLYKRFGYIHSLKRFRYELLDMSLTKTDDLDAIWLAKKELFRASRTGLKILETKEQFIKSRKEHRFFTCGSSYLAFAPSSDSFTLYEAISPLGEPLPIEAVHYERSALIYDITETLDAEFIEKQKPELSYLLN